MDDVIDVAADSTTSWCIYQWRWRDSSVTCFSIIDVGAVDSKRPLTVDNVAWPAARANSICNYKSQYYPKCLDNNKQR